ncbi:MAG: flagellar hook-associated protein FlgL [Cellulosilyticum sp.]|nr:flagellar hook-associated protein FlgL [Cellulosilyticum sp.]
MRVTNGMIINTTLHGLYSNMNALNKTYAQMATGKKIQTVSDDPIIAGRALKLKSTVLETAQFESNTKEALSWMEVTESSLDNMTGILQDIRTKCVQASNGTLEEEDLAAVKTDIEQLWQQLQEEANTTYNGRYVFSGYKTDQELMKDGSVNPEILKNGVDETVEQGIEYEIGVNTTITVNTQGMGEIFNEIKTQLEEIISSVEDENLDSTEMNKMFTDKLEDIDNILDKVSEKTTELGSKMSRAIYTQERLTDQETSFKTLLSSTEDIDIEETYVNFNTQYMAYQSALQATSKIIQNTLADYL